MSHDEFKRDFDEFSREMKRAQERAHLLAMIAIPIYAIGILLILGLLAVGLYAALRAVGVL